MYSRLTCSLRYIGIIVYFFPAPASEQYMSVTGHTAYSFTVSCQLSAVKFSQFRFRVPPRFRVVRHSSDSESFSSPSRFILLFRSFRSSLILVR